MEWSCPHRSARSSAVADLRDGKIDGLGPWSGIRYVEFCLQPSQYWYLE